MQKSFHCVKLHGFHNLYGKWLSIKDYGPEPGTLSIAFSHDRQLAFAIDMPLTVAQVTPQPHSQFNLVETCEQLGR